MTVIGSCFQSVRALKLHYFKWNTLYIIRLLNRARRDDFNDIWFVGFIYNTFFKK